MSNMHRLSIISHQTSSICATQPEHLLSISHFVTFTGRIFACAFLAQLFFGEDLIIRSDLMRESRFFKIKA